jgi:hypothetical protein
VDKLTKSEKVRLTLLVAGVCIVEKIKTTMIDAIDALRYGDGKDEN